MRTIHFIGLIILTLGTLASCSNDVSMDDKESEIKKPPISLPGDVDGDGVLDEDDNCPTLANADQADEDGDGTGDVCEGLADTCETNFCQENKIVRGHHCDGEQSVQCGVGLEGCMVEVSRHTCEAGCDTEVFPGYCSSPPVEAGDPQIQEASGSPTHGSALTLTGVDFGTHEDFHEDADKLVHMWETFETGDFVSNPYGAWGDWNGYDSIELRENDATARGAAQDNFLYHRNDKSLGGILVESGDHEEYWLSMWVRFSDQWEFGCKDPDHEATEGWKGARIGSTNQTANLYPSWGKNGGGFAWNIEYIEPGGSTWQTQFLNEIDPPDGQPPARWERWDQRIRKSSFAGAFDGKLELRVNNKLVYDYKTMTAPYHDVPDFDTAGADLADSIRIGSYFSQACSGNYVQYDDIFFNHSLARVELGNTPIFETSDHLEVQPPTTWSDGSVSITLNHGTFQAGEKVFLFVISENGNASPGYPITLE